MTKKRNIATSPCAIIVIKKAYINKKNDEKKKEILLQVSVLEGTEQRYGLNKGYVLNFSSVMFAFIALCEKK